MSPALLGLLLAVPPRPVFQPPQVAHHPAVAAEARAHATPTHDFLRVGSRAELAIGSDGSVWYGPAGDVCLLFNPFYWGLTFHWARTRERSEEPGYQTIGEQTQLHLVFGARIRFARFTIEGHAGTGIALIRRFEYTPFLAPCRATCDPSSGRSLHSDGLSFAAGLATTLDLLAWLGVYATLDGTTPPLARGQQRGNAADLGFLRLGLGLRLEI